ncbi:AMP-binding protein [Mycobacterium kyogaense]|uniref:AMP-binding protein n=1 Tax=Mycobacterium kyogaense TaxID=2212479 RepID=UPI0013C48F90|nr:AMP-binding protein [Mycobacterium kyogaense]
MRTASPGLYERLLQLKDDHPDKIAVITGDQQHSFADLFTRIERLTRHLAAEGIGAGERVLWVGGNSHHILELMIACSRLSATLCPVNWRQSPDELAFVLRDWAPRVVVWQSIDGEDRLTDARTRAAAPGAVWLPVDVAGEYDMRSIAGLPLEQQTDVGTAQPSDVPILALYTAAFSGHPGAALLSEHGLYLQALAHIPVLEATADDVNLVATPLFHVLGWVSLLTFFVCGSTNVFIPRPDAEVICRAIVANGGTTGTVMPQTALQIGELNADGRYDLSRFRSAVRVRGWRDMTRPGTMVGGYGQTETGGPVLLALPGARLGGPIQGRPSPVARVRVVDDSGRDVAVDETGELLVSGPTVTVGYWNRPAENDERRRGVWWRTTDLGRRDDAGVITFIGPNRRMIKTGGENVYPAEVEACLEAHPQVKSAALVGVADKTWGQVVAAIAVRETDGEVDEPTLIAYAQDKLARYKAPRQVIFVEDMPTVNGTKDYQELDARFGGGNYPGSA